MSKWTISRKIAAGFLLVLLQSLSVGVYALWKTAQTSNKLNLISSEYLPENELAAQIEQGLLNARIHFIYFITIQKAGSLGKGWERLQNTEQQLLKLRQLVARSATFRPIRADVDQLCRDFNSYKPALEHVIEMVQRHENQESEYAALLDEVTRLGGAMVDSAGRLSRSGTEAADASARHASARRTTWTLACACLAGLLIGVWLTFGGHTGHCRWPGAGHPGTR